MPLPHPAEFPYAAAQLIINRLRGQNVPLIDLIDAGLEVLHYAAHQFLGDHNPNPVFGDATPLTEEQVCDCLESCCNNKGVQSSAVPWLPLALAMIQLLTAWLRGK